MEFVRNIGDRLELLLDDWLIERMQDVSLRLHHPVPREVAMESDRSHGGNNCGYITVFRDGDRCRMYYGAGKTDIERGLREGQEGMKAGGPRAVCYAESRDGIQWQRPALGLFEHNGSRDNNIVWKVEKPRPKGHGGFSPFKDTNPDCDPGSQYKAVGSGKGGLYALQSPDGLHWSLMQEEPILTSNQFDSQNLSFWDAVRGEYRSYMRGMIDGRRHVRTATSPDFENWTEPEYIACPGAPNEELYTNQVIPYYRAPHILVGFPTRYTRRRWSEVIETWTEVEHRRRISSIKERYGTDLTDGLFMSSRDGKTFHRWGEAFLRPGPQLSGNWFYGDNYQGWGMLETASALEGAPPELSFYATENAWKEKRIFRRYTLRMDGFVSVQAPRSRGEFLTKPLTFDGQFLTLNMSTSAAGSIKVEIQDVTGKPIQGFAMEDGVEMIGDRLDFHAHWRGHPDLGRLAGKPVRLRFVMQDADLYALQFKSETKRSLDP